MTGSAALLKMTAGTDDLVWLAPFLAHNRTTAGKLWTSFLYAASVTFLISIAAFLGIQMTAIASEAAAALKMWLSRVTGLLLCMYSAYMAYTEGWFTPCGWSGSKDDVGYDEETALASLLPDADAGEETAQDNVIIVAMLGSLDDFVVYLVVAGSGMYTWHELVVGTMVGCLVLAAIVALLTENRTLSSMLEKLPAWLVLMVLGIYTLVSALLGTDD